MSDEDDASGIAEDVATPTLERDDATETEAPEADSEEFDAQAPDDELDAADADEDEGDEDEPDEEIELNLGGKTVRLNASQTAKEAAELVQQFADDTWKAHTARSEEIANTRKQLQARTEALEAITTMDEAAFQSYTQAKQYDAAIASLEQQMQGIDRASDPDGYRFASDDLARYRQAAEQARQVVLHHETQGQAARAAEAKRLQEEGAAKVIKAVPKFNADEVIDYVVSAYDGFDREAAKTTWAMNPAFAIMAHKAMQHDRMTASARKARPAAQKKANPVKPVARKGGPARRSLENMSPEEFHAIRLKQRRGG